MTELPAGWAPTTLGKLGRYLNGRGFKKSEWAASGRPIIRIQNLTGTSEQFNHFSGEAEDRYVARPGDLLVSWAATLGAYIWPGPEAVVNQHIFKVESNIDVKFHKYLLDAKLGELMRETHGSGMVHITRGKFDAVPVLVPPIDEQRRVVDVLEDHLSRLDAATDGLVTAGRRLAVWEAAVLSDCYTSAERVPLASVTKIQGGIQKQPKRVPRKNAYPFLRVANVTAGGLDLTEVHQIELFDGELGRLALRAGDLLVVEGNGSPSQIGRAATWDGSIEDCVHQNHLIRVRPIEPLQPEFLEAVWNAPQNRELLSRISSSSSGLHTLSVAKLKSLTIPLPSTEEQAAFCARVAELRLSRRRLDHTISVAQRRCAYLRRALLQAAFSGRLTYRTSDDVLEGLVAST